MCVSPGWRNVGIVCSLGKERRCGCIVTREPLKISLTLVFLPTKNETTEYQSHCALVRATVSSSSPRSHTLIFELYPPPPSSLFTQAGPRQSPAGGGRCEAPRKAKAVVLAHRPRLPEVGEQSRRGRSSWGEVGVLAASAADASAAPSTAAVAAVAAIHEAG